MVSKRCYCGKFRRQIGIKLFFGLPVSLMFSFFTGLAVGQATPSAVLSDSNSAMPSSPGNDTTAIRSGTDLYCYECSETYDSTFDPAQSPCLFNLSQITIRQCSVADNYCQVQIEQYVSFPAVMSISRGCVQTCPYGCYFHNYGSATEVCISCCRTYGCNTGNGATGKHKTVQHQMQQLLPLLPMMLTTKSFAIGYWT